MLSWHCLLWPCLVCPLLPPELDSEFMERRNYILTQVWILCHTLLRFWHQRRSQSVLAGPWVLVSAFTRVEGTNLRLSDFTINDFLRISWGNMIVAGHVLGIQIKRTFPKLCCCFHKVPTLGLSPHFCVIALKVDNSKGRGKDWTPPSFERTQEAS